MSKYTMIFILILSAIYAQNSGKITGRVIDADTKDVLIGANILIEGTDKGTAADADGKFEFTNLEYGSYRLKISYVGYISEILTDIIVKPGKPAIVNVELKQSSIQTDEVIVSAGYFVEEIMTAPSTIGLSKEEIRRYPGGFEDVVRTVSTLPGVAINSSGGRNDLLVRGGGPAENLYVINNIEVPNINHFGTQGTSSGTLSFVNLDFVEKVTFSTGGFGAEYGDKLSSVLALKMTEGRNDRLGAKALVSATQYGLNIEGPLSKKGNFIFSARKSYLDLIFKAAGLAFIPVYTDFNFVANYELSKNDKLFVLGLAAIDKIDRDLDSEENRIKNERLLDNTQDQFITGLNYRRILETGYADITANVNLFNYRFSQIDRNDEEYFSSEADEYEYGFKAQRFWSFDNNLNLQIGLSAKINNNKNNTSFADSIYNSSGNLIPITETGIPQNTNTDLWGRKFAAFANTEINITEKLKANIGLRADYFSDIKNSEYFSPRIGLKYKVDSKNSLKLNYGIYYQSPSQVWLVNENNRNLNALQNQMFILGWNHLFREDIRITIESYYKKYDDLPTGTIPGVTDYLVISNTGGNFGGRNDDFNSFGFYDLVSEGTGRAYGAELTIQKKYSDTPLYGQSSLSYGKSEVTAFNGETYPSAFDQRFIFNISGGYKFDNNWEISGKFRYFTGVPYTPIYKPSDNPVNPGTVKNVPSEYLADRLESGHHLDVRVDRYFFFESWTLTVYADIQNVYNYEVPRKPQYDFYENKVETTSSIGLLPSIGISAEF